MDVNAKRAAEDPRGQIRWLRPDFQNAAGTATQTGLDTGPDDLTTPRRRPPRPRRKNDLYSNDHFDSVSRTTRKPACRR